MHAKATKANTPRRWRPLSQAQLNAIDCLLAGINDTETAADPRVHTCRQTVWDWKFHDPLFMAELQQRRASLWASTHERLRGLMGKAISNIAASVESGNVADSWNLLKCIGLFCDGTENAVPGVHIERELDRLAHQQAVQEYEALGSTARALANLDGDGLQEHRKQHILDELIKEYIEPEASTLHGHASNRPHGEGRHETHDAL